MKLVLITTMYKRHELTDFVFSYYNSLKNKLKDKFELILLACGSEGSISSTIAKNNGFNYVEFNNFPLSDKHNKLLSESKKFNPDGIILIGSDDLISESTFLTYYESCKNGIDFLGFKDLYMYDGILHYWGGYTNKRINETVGAGRFFSRNLLDICDWDLWGGSKINKGLDSLCYNKIKNLNIKKDVIFCDNNKNFIVDIKAENNLTKIENFKDSLKQINKKNLLNQLNIDINYLDNFIINKGKYDLSIIISTYKNTQYLDDCFNSIIESIGNKTVEVLIGIDSCMESYNFVLGKTYPSNFKFYFFKKNNGPYIVFNSLSKISKSDNIMFFGSDDIMDKNMVGDVIDGLNGYDCVKPVYIDFKDGDIININSKKYLGEGVFGVKKSIFNYLNGFEPWMCAADSDFMGRLYKNRYKLRYTNRINFYRRIHKNGLTSRPDTGMSSPLRAQYAKLSRNKKVAGPLKIMVTEPYSLINGVNYLPKMVYDDDTLNVVDPNYELMLKLRKESLSKVFNHENYRVAPPVEKIEKKISSINYEKINNLLNNKVIPKPIPKVKQVNNTPENKKIITNKEMVKLTFPGKKNRRSGDNTMSFVGKINK